MKSKKLLTLIILLLITLTLSSCNILPKDVSNSQSNQAKVIAALNNMKSYSCTATIEFISNKNSNVYEVSQMCQSDGKYRVEVTGPSKVAGNVICSDGKTISQFNPNLNGNINIRTDENRVRSELFITTFMYNYKNSGIVSTSSVQNDSDEESYTVLETDIPSNSELLSSEKLWMSNNTLQPNKLVIYDSDGIERIVVTYTSFEYNTNLDEDIFIIP